MAKVLWLNLSVENPKKSADFFAALGFEIKKEFSNPASETAVLNDGTQLMLVENKFFEEASKRKIADTTTHAEVVLATQVDNQGEVDEIVNKANKAGGKEVGEAFEHEGMYTRIFRDLDGHQFNIFAFL